MIHRCVLVPGGDPSGQSSAEEASSRNLGVASSELGPHARFGLKEVKHGTGPITATAGVFRTGFHCVEAGAWKAAMQSIAISKTEAMKWQRLPESQYRR